MNSDIPHPCDSFDLIGHQAAEAEFVEAMARGRLHHAWLVTGPDGVGKSTFAYRAARRLLGAEVDPDGGPLASRPDDPVCRQIIGRAHPDLFALQRLSEDGKARRDLPVEEVRELGAFFAKSAGQGGARVAIVDDADHLNTHGVNALLKTLEEPPTRGVLFLVCAVPGRLPATLRSRCRRLRLTAPDAATIGGWLRARVGIDADVARALAAMAGGAPGRAWRMAADGALDLDAAAADILARLPATDEAAIQALADSFRGQAGAIRFGILFDRLASRVRDLAIARTDDGATAAAEAWAEVFPTLIGLPRQAEAVNLDRSDVLYTTLATMAAVA